MKKSTSKDIIRSLKKQTLKNKEIWCTKKNYAFPPYLYYFENYLFPFQSAPRNRPHLDLRQIESVHLYKWLRHTFDSGPLARPNYETVLLFSFFLQVTFFTNWPSKQMISHHFQFYPYTHTIYREFHDKYQIRGHGSMWLNQCNSLLLDHYEECGMPPYPLLLI